MAADTLLKRVEEEIARASEKYPSADAIKRFIDAVNPMTWKEIGISIRHADGTTSDFTVTNDRVLSDSQ